uniref:Verticillium wilt resistance-like protein n=1 Tax=Kalanchoe fedtschenkoi TaxID=63787 RepID=A0A7N0TAG3_KALFE
MAATSSYLYHVCALCLLCLLGLDEVTGQCLEHQKSLLLKLNRSLTTRNDTGAGYVTRLAKWDSTGDCCSWPGVTCSPNGYVTGLDLSSEGTYIELKLNYSSPLFDLHYLTSLNLAGSKFHSSTSAGFERLVNLMHLNLSYSLITGPFPIEISNLTRLVTLDFSHNFYFEDMPGPRSLRVDSFSLRALVGNLSQLMQLRLERVDLENDWSEAVSSLPHLQELSLRNCGLSGPIHASLQNLTSLSIIDLTGNNLSVPFPKWFSSFKNLTSLGLGGCGFSGKIPDDLGDLKMLSTLDLHKSDLEGVIPKSLAKLTGLTHLDLSGNKLSGSVPSFSAYKNLTYLRLSNNQLSGSLLSTNWNELSKLVNINLDDNHLSGSIPVSLCGIPSLRYLQLSYNHFTNFTNEQAIITSYSSQLEHLNLDDNNLQGPFPAFIFELQSLTDLILSYNHIGGTLRFEALQQLKNLAFLDLSYNNISVEFGEEPLTFPRLSGLKLASCNLKAFPKLAGISDLEFWGLDFSANRITGHIPDWTWNAFHDGAYLNLSHNQLQAFESAAGDSVAGIIDLSSNELQGSIPQFPSALHLNLSGNSFNASVFSSIHESYATYYFSLANNSLHGNIPESACNAESTAFDMSNNFLSGELPQCLTQIPNSKLLNFMNNNFTGLIPDTFPITCSLEYLNLNGNSFHGAIPKSLKRCAGLKALDLGNNQLHGEFPCWMSDAHVLVLKSNMFYGSILCPNVSANWSRLQIIDIASNNFSGSLPSWQLLEWRSMMVNDDSNSQLQDIYDPEYMSLPIGLFGYHITVTLTVKGTERILPKISTAFNLIDFSDNAFEGPVPDELGHLKALHLLNMSYNRLTGQISASLGSMRNLESLDLAKNELSGKIPFALANLTSLAVLNLSFNRLEGMIPTGPQFQTFTEASFMHNKGLCGFPVSTSCAKEAELDRSAAKPSLDVEWEVMISAEVGYAEGMGFVIMPLIFWPRWRMRYYEFLEKSFKRILCRRT